MTIETRMKAVSVAFNGDKCSGMCEWAEMQTREITRCCLYHFNLYRDGSGQSRRCTRCLDEFQKSTEADNAN